ncbi:Gfo/Idh/MocA family protein [Paenibacillus sp. Root444D2]|jgi:predicted dehydrogenase|uniref:Gfo/Idh/MocA family protein n=1 Tax=Paenibacillus sp. Root444D2 TaxID=1736538 RepID=UPI00070916A4|nr:Gfo/Idh/MocA family oxidoreductase [Paenibacillus sp. Root444D2]KQX48850.1 oxidoreductase [Paenibacillus sp. Root444D2]
MVELKLGLIGLDTSHSKVFSKILNDSNDPNHISGGRVIAAFPGGSPDFKASATRVDGYTADLRDGLGVHIAESPEEVAMSCDAILLTSVDGRVHLEQFAKIAPYGKPVFIDKPLAISLKEAQTIAHIAELHGIPWMSGSVRRYADALNAALNRENNSNITGVDCYGPIEFTPTQPGYYWYGIHLVDVLYRILGTGCRSVTAFSENGHETVTAVWKDGRIGTLRGNLHNGTHGTLIHREKVSEYVDTAADGLRKYANLLQDILHMFRTGEPRIIPHETLEIIRFIEAVNESRDSGKTVSL